MTAASMTGRWQDAERLFRADERWLAGDDAYSIQLDDVRRLWLFGDTFVARRVGGGRDDAHFIHNSIAIQQGPVGAADMEFMWRGTDSQPAAFFGPPSRPGVYRWPGHGVLIGDALLLFFMLVRDVDDRPEGIETLTFFEIVGWDAVVVDARHRPRDWDPRAVRPPDAGFLELLGSGGVLRHGDHVYAHGWAAGTTYLARWPQDRAASGDLREPEWWGGPDLGWSKTAAPAPTLTEVGTEFTVHHEPTIGGFVHTQMVGLDEARLEVRSAAEPQGPWSPPLVIHRVPRREQAFSYAGKAHPGLARDGLAATYNTIPFTLAGIRERPDTYVPRVVSIPGGALEGLREGLRP